jgi:hypothetical protein
MLLKMTENIVMGDIDEILLPGDIQKFFHDTLSPTEQDCLTFFIHHINAYIKKETKKVKFTIHTERRERIFRSHPFSLDAKRNGDSATIYYESGNKYEEQVTTAVALAVLLFVYLPQELNKTVSSDVGQRVLYCAQQLLEYNSKLENGAFLRHMYVLPSEKVLDMLHKFYPDYRHEAVTDEIKNETKNLFNNIFVDGFDDFPILRREINAVSTFVKNKFHFEISAGVRGNNAVVFPINVIIGDNGFDKPWGRTNTFNSSRYGMGCNILHKSKGEYEKYLPGEILEKKEHKVEKKYAKSLVRLNIAHELGHVVCHYKYGDSKSYERDKKERNAKMELEAACFAKHLLQHREYLYCGSNENCKEFEKACDDWGELFYYVHITHGGYDEKWWSQFSSHKIDWKK